MRKVITIIAFQIGVDCLGFPQYHTHELTTVEQSPHKRQTSKYFNPYSKK